MNPNAKIAPNNENTINDTPEGIVENIFYETKKELIKQISEQVKEELIVEIKKATDKTNAIKMNINTEMHKEICQTILKITPYDHQ